ncbi:MAG TPA: hypothetical protein VGI14_11560 [Casimicrobiaceae bacterium]|jgi:hypothetical protein
MPHEGPVDFESRKRSPITAGAILVGVVVAVTLAIDGAVHVARLLEAADAADAAGRSGSFEVPTWSDPLHPSETT